MEKELTEIVITEKDGEVIAIIPINKKEKDIVQKKDIVIEMNYGEPYSYVGNETTGKVYLKKG